MYRRRQSLISLLLSYLLFTVQIGSAHADAPQLETPCEISLRGIFSPSGDNHLRGALFDSVPSSGVSVAKHKNAASIAVLYQLPKGPAEYQQIFFPKAKTQIVTRAQQAEISDANQFLAKVRPVPSEPAIQNLDQFKSFLHSTNSRYVVLVGHNEDGQFAFLTGTTVELAILEKNCELAIKKCIFISCSSKDYLTSGTSVGVERDLTLKEGIEIAEAIRNFVASRSATTTDLEIANKIHAIETRSHLKYHVTYMVLRGCTTIAGIITVALVIQSIGCIGSDKNKCSL